MSDVNHIPKQKNSASALWGLIGPSGGGCVCEATGTALNCRLPIASMYPIPLITRRPRPIAGHSTPTKSRRRMQMRCWALAKLGCTALLPCGQNETTSGCPIPISQCRTIDMNNAFVNEVL